MKEKVEEKTTTKVVKNTFTKESIINSNKYSNRKDLLNGLLKDDKEYTFEQVDEMIDKFMKGKVK